MDAVHPLGKIDVDENMRAVVQGKSNLAAPGAPMAFGLEPGGGLTCISRMTLDRAKQTLGVKSLKRQRQWLWTLGGSEDIQDIHAGSLNALNVLPPLQTGTVDSDKQEYQDTHAGNLNSLPLEREAC